MPSLQDLFKTLLLCLAFLSLAYGLATLVP